MTAPPGLRVADVFRAHWVEYLRTHSVPVLQLKAIRHLLACRTPALGGHVWRCPSCGHEAVLYNSCRDRHCPIAIKLTRIFHKLLKRTRKKVGESTWDSPAVGGEEKG